jgi:Zn-dependent peptidase ImmA (M78 family)/transcriptional regulator with XRE-family HTH domain
MESMQELLGRRIREMRERLGITQRQLAEQAGFSAHQTVSEVERGGRGVKAWELVRIARALRTDTQALLSTECLEEPPVVLWRDQPAENASVMEASFLQRCRQYHQLETLLGVPTSPGLLEMSVDPATVDHQDARSLAETISRFLKLGSRPAVSLFRVLENDYRIKIWYESMGDKGSAASVVGDFGYAILMNRDQAPWRRNYSFAHELFHLITWKSLPPELLMSNDSLRERVEGVAQVFASNLLLPTDIVTLEFDRRVQSGKIKYADLIEIAREFDVSTEALLWSLVHLKRLGRADVERALADQHFRAMDRDTMPKRWWQPPTLPERFVRLAFWAFQEGKISRSRLAQLLETSLIDLQQTLMEYGLAEAEDYQAEVSVA